MPALEPAIRPLAELIATLFSLATLIMLVPANFDPVLAKLALLALFWDDTTAVEADSGRPTLARLTPLKLKHFNVVYKYIYIIFDKWMIKMYILFDTELMKLLLKPKLILYLKY